MAPSRPSLPPRCREWCSTPCGTAGLRDRPGEGRSPARVDVHLFNHPDTLTPLQTYDRGTSGARLRPRHGRRRRRQARRQVHRVHVRCQPCSGAPARRRLSRAGGLRRPGCRSLKFVREGDSVRCADSQRVRLQELIDDAAEDDGGSARGRRRRAGGDALRQLAAGTW